MSKKKEVVEEVLNDIQEVHDDIVKPYTLRPLRNGDLWPVLKILGRLLPEDLKKAFVQVASGEKGIRDVGMAVGFDMATMIIQNAYKAQDDVDSFCADVAGVTVDELNEMEFGTTALIIMDLFNDAKSASFFKALSRFFS